MYSLCINRRVANFDSFFRNSVVRQSFSMAVYKDVEIDDALVGLIGHMHGVENYREALGRLQASWDTLTLLGQLSGSAAEMSGTREAFEKLSGQLLNHLGLETRKKVLADLRTKAQNGIDILVRNLFERTADIGFLAADTDVREFLASAGTDRAPIEARFAEYVAKYSVYRDILLFDTRGRIRARLAKHAAEATTHGLVHDALTTQGAYVEYFGPADFLADGDQLVYAFRVNDLNGYALGALALVFRLDDEMQGIFGNLVPADDWTLLACTTPQGQVIASSCSIQLPVGYRLPPSLLRADGQTVRLGGRQYLAIGCQPSPYQGYGGPGWHGLGLIPIEMAFDDNGKAAAGERHQDLIETVMRNPALFSDALRSIPEQAARIQSDLNRSVWNGSVRRMEADGVNASFSKTLLWEISSAGRRTQAVFDQSIGNLQQTVIAAISQKTASRAAFAIDVMDRNLYERANDCRWWALDTTFRRVLADPSPDGLHRCCEILAAINGLYTVYSNLLLFDATGMIVAVSKDDQSHLVGTRIEEPWIGRTLALASTQDYAVSDFVPTPLYGGEATCIFGAAVRHPDDGRPVGGVGIVFDAGPQFSAMLKDALPRDERGEMMPNSFSLFVDRQGKVLASSDPRFAIGTRCGLDLRLDDLATGQSRAEVISHQGHFYSVGVTLSSGYREYKVSDGYEPDVISICAAQLGKEVAHAPRHAAGGSKALRNHRTGSDMIELATFYVGEYWFGLQVQDVLEAIDATGMTTATGGAGGALIGYKIYQDVPIPVLDLARCTGIGAPTSDEQHVVVTRAGGELVGLLIDALGEIPEVQASDIVPLESLKWSGHLPATGIVRNPADDDPRAPVLIVLDMSRLGDFLGPQAQQPVMVAAE
jgi:chemotaxis signal transduction protein